MKPYSHGKIENSITSGLNTKIRPPSEAGFRLMQNNIAKYGVMEEDICNSAGIGFSDGGYCDSQGDNWGREG